MSFISQKREIGKPTATILGQEKINSRISGPNSITGVIILDVNVLDKLTSRFCYMELIRKQFLKHMMFFKSLIFGRPRLKAKARKYKHYIVFLADKMLERPYNPSSKLPINFAYPIFIKHST